MSDLLYDKLFCRPTEVISAPSEVEAMMTKSKTGVGEMLSVSLAWLIVAGHEVKANYTKCTARAKRVVCAILKCFKFFMVVYIGLFCMSDVLECCKINQTMVKKKTMIPLKMVKMIVEVKKSALKTVNVRKND